MLLLPNYFKIFLFQSLPIILTPQDYLLIITCFYRQLTFLQENVSLHLFVQKRGPQYETLLIRLIHLPSKGNLRYAYYMKKIIYYVFRLNYTK